MLVSLPCALLALMLLDDTSGFQGCLHRNKNNLLVGKSMPLLTTTNSAGVTTSSSRTALFDRSLIGLEGDPFEDDRMQKIPRPNEKNDSPSTRNVDEKKKTIRSIPKERLRLVATEF